MRRFSEQDHAEYWQRTPATDIFRRVAGLHVILANGDEMQLAEIVEREARARVKRILREHVEIRRQQLDIEKTLKEESMRVDFYEDGEGDCPC